MVRSILAAVIGVIIAGTVVAIVEMLGSVIHPLPPDVDPFKDTEAMNEHIRNAPVAAMLVVLAAYYLGTFTGTCFAAWFASPGKWPAALFVTIVMVILTYITLRQIEHPTWFWISALLGIPVAGHIGFYLGAKLGAATASERTETK